MFEVRFLIPGDHLLYSHVAARTFCNTQTMSDSAQRRSHQLETGESKRLFAENSILGCFHRLGNAVQGFT